MTSVSTERTVTAILMILGFVVFLVVGYLFTARVIWEMPSAQTALHLRIERGMVIAAFLINVMGFVLLEDLLRESGDRIIARLALALYLVAAAVMVSAEMASLSSSAQVYPQFVAHVVLAFIAQAAFGASLIRTDLTPAWAGWAALLWNAALLVIMPIFFQRDMYFPWLHYVAPLVIGIALLLKR